MANPNTKWIPPLPPGWEGRWDANQRAYFYIDHATKETTWTDPRFNPSVTAQPAFPPQKSLYGQKTVPGLSPEPTFVDDTMADNIHRDYWRVPLDTIKDIVSACNFNETEARVMLTRMGYQKGTDVSHSSLSTDVPASRPRSAAKGKAKAKSPTRSPARSPSPAPAPPAPPVSEKEKKRALSKLKSEFPDLDPNVVSMALDVCEHKEAQAREVLTGWGETNGAGNKARTRPKISSETTFAASGSLEPVPFDSDEPSPSRRHDARPSTGHKSTNNARPSTGHKSAKPKKKTSVATSHPGQTRNKPTHVTQQGRSQRQVITHQPMTNANGSTQANGPNPEMKKGPDKSILLSEYTLLRGPNLSNRQGPDPTRVFGALGGAGPDPMNHCGAQVLSSSGAHTRHQPYLVTNI